MKLLALDQSSHTTGYAIFQDGKLISYDKFSYEDEEIGARLTKIRNKIIQLIDTNEITDVAFEDIQLQNNKGPNNVVTYKILAEVFGVIEQLLNEKKIPYQIVPSTSWKSTLSIKGAQRAEQKRNAQAWVLANCGVKAIQDICDAICIGEHVLRKNTKSFNDVGFDWSD